MLKRMVVGDLRRSVGSSVVLTLLIALAALLATLSALVLGQLLGSMSHLSDRAHPPDLVQMHSGELDAAEVESWASDNDQITDYQVVRTIPIGNEAIAFGGDTDSSDVLEPMFITQPERFDLLIGLDDEPVDPAPGEVAVPLPYRDGRGVQVGDQIEIATPNGPVTLTICDFTRDAQMNSTLVTSKRFVVHPDDYATLAASTDDVEYLVEFEIDESASATKVGDQYTKANLPSNGVQVTGGTMQLLNGMSHGLVIAVFALVALLLILVTLLSVRLTFLTAMQRDKREIGVMKAIGIPARRIKLQALGKYALLGVVGAVVGFGVALLVGPSLTRDITEYYGSPQGSVLRALLPIVAALAVLLLLLAFCWLLLRRYDRLTVLDGLREPPEGAGSAGAQRMHLSRSRRLAADIWMGLNAVVGSIRRHVLLVLMLALGVFMIVVPVNVATTLGSPSFATYLGVGDSDLRLDLRTGEEGLQRYKEIDSAIANNPDVAKSVGHITVRYEIVTPDGSTESVPVENGDQTTYPMGYIDGRAPTGPDEIALSALEADSIKAKAGDSVVIRTASHGELTLTMTGIYQDVTNGGKTGRADLPIEGEPVLWFNVTFDAADGVDAAELSKQLADEFSDARVTVVQDYANRTFGGTISQVNLAAVVCSLAALALVFLITALFARMVLAADSTKVAIQRALGISDGSIRTQYYVRFGVALVAGVVIGVLLAHFLGGLLFSKGVGGMIGAPEIGFVVQPWLAYVAAPLALAAVVGGATALSTANVGSLKITQVTQE